MQSLSVFTRIFTMIYQGLELQSNVFIFAQNFRSIKKKIEILFVIPVLPYTYFQRGNGESGLLRFLGFSLYSQDSHCTFGTSTYSRDCHCTPGLSPYFWDFGDFHCTPMASEIPKIRRFLLGRIQSYKRTLKKLQKKMIKYLLSFFFLCSNVVFKKNLFSYHVLHLF